MRRGLRTLLVPILLGVSAGVLVLIGSTLLQALDPARLADLDRLVETIWWPATALRCAVYALLAWGVFPRWAARRPAGGVDDAARRRRLRGRAPRVFAGLLGGDLLLAQLPYALLRG